MKKRVIPRRGCKKIVPSARNFRIAIARCRLSGKLGGHINLFLFDKMQIHLVQGTFLSNKKTPPPKGTTAPWFHPNSAGYNIHALMPLTRADAQPFPAAGSKVHFRNTRHRRLSAYAALSERSVNRTSPCHRLSLSILLYTKSVGFATTF